MNTRDDFDDIVSARLRAAAPGEAPDHLMDSIIARVAASPQRRGGPFAWLGSPLFRVAAVAVVLVAAVLAGTQFGGLIGRPAGVDPSAESSPSGPSAASPGPSATELTPAPSATPESSQAGSSEELVLRVKYAGGVSFGPDVMPEFTLMADGTVVWLPIPSGGTPPTLVTRNLTPDGLADLREHIFASGFLDESATYELEPRPDAGEPPGRGIGIYTFTVGGEPDPVVVSAVQWTGDEYEATYFQPSPEREALDTLAQQLRAPESLVGDDAWIDGAAAYEAPDYQLVLRLIPDIPPYGTMDASEIPWPFDESLDEFGEQAGQVSEARCGIIAAAEAAPIVEAIAAGGILAGMDAVTIASLDWAEGNGVVDVFLIPRMPDGHAECTDLP